MIDKIVTIIKLTKLSTIKKILYFFLTYIQMLQINKEEYEECKIEVIDKGRYFWVNRKEL